ncbi:hypothetical protein PR202_gb21550 [Eleusine coracana subsp. coracana]|uniref:Uncharacterized protein n=1 Tax=Eleusine coracana subsp. coracana TaxID=191504 RepID=A0AAV5FBF2_ELECO|nr:hypothetical protein PR202_gb21550 [Eleusine coracana subsp. coracana]
MALQDNSSAATYSPQQVAGAFVNQYYQTLRNSPEHVHCFYSDSSTLGREDSNGNMISVTTMSGINTQIMSTDYTRYVIELQTVDAQESYVGCVLILVTGSFTTPAVKRKFTQSFFLAAQGNGSYFVLNDMFRFVSEMPSTAKNEVLANHETTSAHESKAPELPSAASLPVDHVVASPSANDVAPVKNVEMPKVATPASAVKVTPTAPVEKAAPAPTSAEETAPTSSLAEKAPPAPAPAPPKDVTKRTYASISCAAERGYSIFVKNLPYNATVMMVEQEFKRFGAIKPGGVQVRNRIDGFWFGFVEFESQNSMQDALKVGTVYFGSRPSYVEEKRTTTRVRQRWLPRENFRGRGDGYGNNGYYRDGDNMRNGYRNDAVRGQGPRGNGYYQNKNGYHQNGYAQNVNQQRRPTQNNGTVNEKVERANGPAKQTPAAA